MSTDNSAVCLVVGGSGGIGADVARQLAAKGARVIVTGRDAGRLAAIGLETGATTLELEARDSAAVDAVLQQVHASHGRLDGVVNCAGSILLKPAHLITDAEFAETLALNTTTAFYVLRASARVLMRQPGGGSIMLCSSVAARRGLLNHEAGRTEAGAASRLHRRRRFPLGVAGLAAHGGSRGQGEGDGGDQADR